MGGAGGAFSAPAEVNRLSFSVTVNLFGVLRSCGGQPFFYKITLY